jgi:hypothetical protein
MAWTHLEQKQGWCEVLEISNVGFS